MNGSLWRRHMGSSMWNMLAMSGAYLGLFTMAEVLYHVFKVNAESTRKLVHIGTGLLALLFPIIMNNHWQVLLLCSIFALLLLLSLRTGLLQSINGIRRKSYGSLGYPIAVYGSFLAYEYHDRQYVYYYLPVLVLAICDPLAAYIGRKYRFGLYRVGTGIKTISGSAAFFFAAILVTAGVYRYLGNFPTIGYFISVAALVATLATLAESWSSRGLDNVTIPAAVWVGLALAEHVLA
ncbi:phosphatidate cytidylyltransferase [Parapedobacter tibetensis]|uniref:phosphatidate cytidylyltransferase n=1 Tax=Parapedobacter tibetensis TaxID=2972951 RepID=UPI00214D7BA8|nr:phosphatidate cytidylyltransferase [Parapedobacter tibetensis]